jgi:hypothetical protein
MQCLIMSKTSREQVLNLSLYVKFRKLPERYVLYVQFFIPLSGKDFLEHFLSVEE